MTPDTTKIAAGATTDLPPAPAQAVIAIAHTGDYRKDALIDQLGYRWNRDNPVGTAVTVTFSFGASAPSYGNAEDANGFAVFSVEQMQATRDIFARLSTEIGISFTEVADTGATYGQIRLGNNLQSDSSGYAYLPFSSGADGDGDIYISTANTDALTAGSVNYATLVHEIGHAIGLNHPGNYNAGEPSTPNATGNFLGQAEDSLAYSVMSYREVTQGQQRDWFGLYDMLTLQYLYGARQNNAGDNVYALTNDAGAVLTNLIDGGGSDRINLNAVTIAASVDLREGAFSSIGTVSPGVAAVNNFSIGFGTQIENVTGTALTDTLTGNDLRNSIRGLGGNDVITGAGGVDVSEYTGARGNYAISSGATGRTIADSVAERDGTDTLSSIERLQFSDGVLAFDNLRTDNAGRGYLIYRAAFDRVPDLSGLGYWIRELDRGQDYGAVVAASFIASSEFIALNGSNTSNAQYVNLLYQNVLHRAGEASGVAYWLSELNNGGARSNMLASFAISDENYAAVSPLISDGIFFV